MQSLQICMEGYVIRYEPNAYAVETASLQCGKNKNEKYVLQPVLFRRWGF